MTELPPPNRHRRIVQDPRPPANHVTANLFPFPDNYVRKPNPITGFLDKVSRWTKRHKGWSVTIVIAGVLLVISLGALSPKHTADNIDSTPRPMSVCDVVATGPHLTRGDIIGLVMDANPTLSRREAQDWVDRSPCGPR